MFVAHSPDSLSIVHHCCLLANTSFRILKTDDCSKNRKVYSKMREFCKVSKEKKGKKGKILPAIQSTSTNDLIIAVNTHEFYNYK